MSDRRMECEGREASRAAGRRVHRSPRAGLLRRLVLVAALSLLAGVWPAGTAVAGISNPETGEHWWPGMDDPDRGEAAGSCLADAEDFCPDGDEMEGFGTAGQASLVFYYFDDPFLVNLAQEIFNDASKAAEGYDRVALLRADTTLHEAIENLERQADETLDPTFENFFCALHDLISAGYLVDIWVLSHGSETGIYTLPTEEHSKITPADIRERLHPDSNGCNAYLPVRMVYSVACYFSSSAEAYAEVGARAAMGARLINFYPNQFGGFANAWNDGDPFQDAVEDSNTSSSRTLVQAVLELLALREIYGWRSGLADLVADVLEFVGDLTDWETPVRWAEALEDLDLVDLPFLDCVATPNILGKNGCAEAFFTGGFDYGDLEDDYDADASGKSNMNDSSEKLVYGDGGVTKGDTGFDWRPPVDLDIQAVQAEPPYSTGSGYMLGVGLVHYRDVTFQVRVGNDGAFDCLPFTLTLSRAVSGAAGAATQSQEVGTVFAGSSQEVSFTVSIPLNADGSVRTTTLTWEADPGGEMNDTRTPNNDYVLVVDDSLFVPDYGFYCLDSEGLCEDPDDGMTFLVDETTGEVDVYAWPANWGMEAASSSSTLRLFYNECVVAEAVLDPMASAWIAWPGWAPFTFDPAAVPECAVPPLLGPNTIRLVLDADGDIAESDESNNEAAYSWGGLDADDLTPPERVSPVRELMLDPAWFIPEELMVPGWLFEFPMEDCPPRCPESGSEFAAWETMDPWMVDVMREVHAATLRGDAWDPAGSAALESFSGTHRLHAGTIRAAQALSTRYLQGAMTQQQLQAGLGFLAMEESWAAW